MSKFLFYILSISLSTSLFASSFDGFYGGVGAGGSLTTGEFNSSAKGTFDFLPQNFSTDASFASKDVSRRDFPKGELFFGYSCSRKCLYLGTELFASLSSYRMTNSATGGKSEAGIETLTTTALNKIKLNIADYGVDLRPGWILSPFTLLYGRVGVAFNRLFLKSGLSTQDVTFPPVLIAETLALASSNSEKKCAPLCA